VPEREALLDAGTCELAGRWLVDPEVMRRARNAAMQMEFHTGRKVWIISGMRTPAEQDALRRQGRLTAVNSRSTHLSCPATGIDVDLGFGVTNVIKASWGLFVINEGLRWGGGSAIDRSTGIPEDWNHIDRGPRNSS